MHTNTVAQMVQALRKGDYSSQELTQHFLDRIHQFDKALNSFITVCDESALESAKVADQRLATNNAPLLTGIPLAQKDIFCTSGIRTTCGSKMLENFIAPYDATVVTRLKQAGTVMLGKTNMDEFAMGSSNENSYYGAVKNPFDHTCVAGGSSGGSAAAVAAGLTPTATGTDTGGSIRQPAALCGVTGIKPTYGRVSRYGMIAFASSLDQGGIFARNAEDAALLLQTMAGFDPNDSTSVDKETPNYHGMLSNDMGPLKIGLPKEYFTHELDSKIAELIHNAAKKYESMGASLHEISLPTTHLAGPAYYIIAPSECSSNLARYDGVRYGHRCKDPVNLADLYKRSRSEGFGDEVKRRILLGTFALSAGYYDAYYSKAQKIRSLIANDFKQAFKQVDVILSPTAPTTAFKLGEKISDPVSMYLSDVYTMAVNLAGLPAMSIPAGFIEQLPVGLQLIGNYFDEGRLLTMAHRFQQATDWHLKTPDDFTKHAT